MASSPAPAGRDLDAIWVRVDDRLIHGQVTVGWRQYLRYAEIWVVDDLAREDPYLQDALRLAAPQGVEVRVFGMEEAEALEWLPPQSSPIGIGSPVTPTDADEDIGCRATGEGEERALPQGAGLSSSPSWFVRGGTPFRWRRGGAQGGGVLLLVRSPEAALALVERGMPLARLNVGNLASRPGSVRAFKNISLTAAHVEALDALAARGVCITFQLTPEDAQTDWPTVRRRLAM